jgi:hypothetical protein|tara:strand:- start:11188 stop:11880 length:693 start_codon:yes stop_codon:yes gene_type:complete
MKNILNIIIVMLLLGCAKDVPVATIVDPDPIDLKPTREAVGDVKGKGIEVVKKVVEVRSSVNTSKIIAEGIDATAKFIDSNGAKAKSEVSRKLLSEVTELNKELRTAQKQVMETEALQVVSMELVEKVTNSLVAVNRQVGQHEQAYVDQKKAANDALAKAGYMKKERDAAIKERDRAYTWATIGQVAVGIIVLWVIWTIWIKPKLIPAFATWNGARKMRKILSKPDMDFL